MKLSKNLHSRKYNWIWWIRKFVWFLSNWNLSLFSRIFVMPRCRYMIASVSDWKNSPIAFVFFLRKSGFPIGIAPFCISTKNVLEFFCGISAGKTASLMKLAAVNLNFHCKFYDNGTLVVFSRLTAVSVE